MRVKLLHGNNDLYISEKPKCKVVNKVNESYSYKRYSESQKERKKEKLIDLYA